jgi:hypothetical protein
MQRFRYGSTVFCEARDWVKIVGLTDGKIQWPIGSALEADLWSSKRDSSRIVAGRATLVWLQALHGLEAGYGANMGSVGPTHRSSRLRAHDEPSWVASASC